MLPGLAALVSATAAAWEPGVAAWPAGRPVRYCVAPSPEANLSPETQRAIVTRVFDAWADAAPCIGRPLVSAGACSEAGPVEIEVWMTELPWAPTNWIQVDLDAAPMQIFVDTRGWWRDDAEACDGGMVLSSPLAYAVGRALGLVETCTAARCDDEHAAMALRSDVGACEVRYPTSDDGLSLMATYGDPIAFSCDPTIGPAPLEVSCASDPTAEVQVGWEPGAADRSGQHTYAHPGRYRAELEVADPEACLAGRATQEVTACAPNDAPFRASVRDGRLQLALGVDVVPGCVTLSAWTVRDPAGDVVAQPTTASASVAVARAGTYTVRLDVDGAGGAASEERTVAVGSRGCAASGRPGPGLALGALLGLRRRRRDNRP